MTTPKQLVVPDELFQPHMTSRPFPQWAREEIARPEPPWLLKNLVLPGGTTLLGGTPKLGKSFLALLMGMSMASGRGFGPIVPVGRSTVLYIEMEGSPRHSAERGFAVAKGMGIPLRDLDLLHIEDARRFKLQKKGEYDRLVTHIREIGASCVVLDTFRESFTGDENSSEVTARYFDLIKTVQALTGVAFVLVHHIRKQGGNKGEFEFAMDVSDPIRGSSNISASCDVLLMLQEGYLLDDSGSHWGDQQQKFIYAGGKNIANWWCTTDRLMTSENDHLIRAELTFGDIHDGLGTFRYARPSGDPRRR